MAPISCSEVASELADISTAEGFDEVSRHEAARIQKELASCTEIGDSMKTRIKDLFTRCKASLSIQLEDLAQELTDSTQRVATLVNENAAIDAANAAAEADNAKLRASLETRTARIAELEASLTA